MNGGCDCANVPNISTRHLDANEHIQMEMQIAFEL